MSRADILKEILVLEAVAAHAKQLAALRRETLGDQAIAELVKDGTAPTWRVPNVARVSLPTSKEKIEVSNPEQLLDWVALRYPAEIEEVCTKRVRPSFITALTGTMLRVDDDVVSDPDTGEVVPGLSVRPGGQPGSLSITPEPGVKAVIAAYAAEMMSTAQWAIGGPAAPAEPEAAVEESADPFALFPPAGAEER